MSSQVAFGGLALLLCYCKFKLSHYPLPQGALQDGQVVLYKSSLVKTVGQGLLLNIIIEKDIVGDGKVR